MVPIDSFVCQIVHRLRFFRSFDPLPFDGRLAGPSHAGKQTLAAVNFAPTYPMLRRASESARRIVPHQLRHYLPFRTMSCRGVLALCFGANELVCSDIV